MKLATLAVKISHKAGERALEDVILGRLPMNQLPDRCLLWSGAVQGKDGNRRLTTRRDLRHGLLIYYQTDRAYPTIRFQNKRHIVTRLIFIQALGIDYDFRLENICGNTLCVNPTHWVLHKIREEVEEDEELLPEDDWTVEEMEELLEIVLTEKDPGCFEDVMSYGLMEGAPPNLTRQVLVSMGKEYLT